MVKRFGYLLVFSLILAGCNFPFQRQTADPEEVANIVAMTLTAGPQQNLTNTPVIISPTPTLIQPSATPTMADTEETTPSETPTQTVTSTVPSSPAGIKATLGSPSWRDPLDNGKSFGLEGSGYEDENTRVYIENGAMVLSSSSIYGYRGWRLTVTSPENVYLEATINVQSCSEADLYGLVFRAPDYSSGQGYYLGVKCDGHYNVTKWTDAGTTTVISTAASSQLNAGPGQTNEIGVYMTGDNFTIYFNQAMTTQFTDNSFSEGGHFGVFIAGQSPGSFLIRVEEIAYWNLN